MGMRKLENGANFKIKITEPIPISEQILPHSPMDNMQMFACK